VANTALITGASSGIGRDLARLHARQGGDLVIVARRREALEELKAELEEEHAVTVTVLTADLVEAGACKELYRRVSELELSIDVLINNAGFGGHGKFYERSWEQDHAMIQLNIVALSELTHLFLQDMVRRKQGKILNAASTAAFVPGPLQATYYATKAFVLSFSQALAEELREANITVTALCPGAVATEFSETANLEGTAAFRRAAPSMKVAQVGYRAMQRGRLVAINDWKLSLLLNWLVPFLPRRAVLRLSRRTMEKE